MKNSAINSTGSAIASPRYRSFCEATMLSRFTPRSPPTCTVAPGTAPRTAARSAVTDIICCIIGVFLRTETTITLACPSGDRSARPAGPVYALIAPVTSGTFSSRAVSASTAARVPGAATGGPFTSTTAVGPMLLACSVMS